MKALTTMLAQRAAGPAPAEGLKEWRDAAQAQIAETVIDACLFSRPTSYGANQLASHSGLLAGMLLRKSREVRAGGLPEHFLLAVTPDDVIALRRTMKMRGGPLGAPGEEVARWKRSDLRVSSSNGGYMLKVTIESPSEDEKVQCTVFANGLTQDFVALLADPARSTPAAA
ncbi:MAG TPA: hypothetical protein VF066_08095 [Thermoleophilaceae bacterium]